MPRKKKWEHGKYKFLRVRVMLDTANRYIALCEAKRKKVQQDLEEYIIKNIDI